MKKIFLAVTTGVLVTAGWAQAVSFKTIDIGNRYYNDPIGSAMCSERGGVNYISGDSLGEVQLAAETKVLGNRLQIKYNSLNVVLSDSKLGVGQNVGTDWIVFAATVKRVLARLDSNEAKKFLILSIYPSVYQNKGFWDIARLLGATGGRCYNPLVAAEYEFTVYREPEEAASQAPRPALYKQLYTSFCRGDVGGSLTAIRAVPQRWVDFTDFYFTKKLMSMDRDRVEQAKIVDYIIKNGDKDGAAPLSLEDTEKLINAILMPK